MQSEIPHPIFEVKNARVFRGMHCVFENLSLSFKEGEHVAILGPNGAGKTTLLKLITREISPVVHEDSHIKLFGQERVNIWQLRKKIGVVSQDFQSKYEALATGLDVVVSAFFGSVGLHQHQDVTQEHIKRAERELGRFGISNLRDRQFLQLSTGQQRRLLLARACIHKPRVLVFDEPTNSLDVSAAFQILQDMRNLAREGCTIILVTHHLQEVIPEISRVALLEKGKVNFDGEKHLALNSENLSNLFNTPLDVSKSNEFYSWTPARQQ
ncbi:MAG: ATP-binding cassette domain-containing protein [Agarilytica sp.]